MKSLDKKKKACVRASSSLSKREKIMLLMLGAVFVIYLYYAIFYTTIQNRIKRARANVTEYKQAMEDMKGAEELFIDKTNKLEELKKKYEEIKLILPQMEMNPEIIYNIRKFFEGSKVQAKNISIGIPEEVISLKSKPQSPGKYSIIENQNDNGSLIKLLAVPVKIVLSADSYEEVKKFISMFENDMRFSEITDIQITISKGASAESDNKEIQPKAELKTPQEKEVEVVVTDEGEDYKEIPKYDMDSNEKDIYVIPESNPQEENIIEKAGSISKIDVNITAKYYYTSANTNEQPGDSLKNEAFKEGDLFK